MFEKVGQCEVHAHKTNEQYNVLREQNVSFWETRTKKWEGKEKDVTQVLGKHWEVKFTGYVAEKKNNNKKTRATRSATIVEAASINSVKVGSHATERN